MNEEDKLLYTRIPEPPSEMSATSVLIRLMDGIGFRYRWATEGLREEDMEFRPCATSMTIQELLAHIQGLLNISESFITGKKLEKVQPENLVERRINTLEAVRRTRNALTKIDDEFLADRRYQVPWASREFPIWNLINGPISDSLTHIGQIASWRKINDNPIYRANVFLGEPPKS
jgi:hypothetical protein